MNGCVSLVFDRKFEPCPKETRTMEWRTDQRPHPGRKALAFRCARADLAIQLGSLAIDLLPPLLERCEQRRTPVSKIAVEGPVGESGLASDGVSGKVRPWHSLGELHDRINEPLARNGSRPAPALSRQRALRLPEVGPTRAHFAGVGISVPFYLVAIRPAADLLDHLIRHGWYA